jgi:hypothetical protein
MSLPPSHRPEETSEQQWQAARKELPWVPVEKEYRFATEDGPKSRSRKIESLPVPSRKCFKTMSAVGIHPSSFVCPALCMHPTPELEAAFDASARWPSATLSLCVAAESLVPFTPRCLLRVPNPAGEGLKPSLALRRKFAKLVSPPLRVNPRSNCDPIFNGRR